MEKKIETTLDSNFHSVVSFMENQDPNIPLVDVQIDDVPNPQKERGSKRVKKPPNILRSKGSKFKVRA